MSKNYYFIVSLHDEHNVKEKDPVLKMQSDNGSSISQADEADPMQTRKKCKNVCYSILYLSIIFIDLDASIQYDVKFEDKGVQNTTQGTCTLCYNLYLHIHVGIDQFDYLTLSFGMNIMFKLF